MGDDGVCYQPWGGVSDSNHDLAEPSKKFWEMIGRTLRPRGKIILIGCNMGLLQYANQVAAASGRTVYASTDLFAAGKSETVVRYVSSLENENVVLRPLKRFKP